jgi:hypothetical protein
MSRLMTNASGTEIIMTASAEARMKEQGDWWKFKKRKFMEIGKGDPKYILLDLRMNGLGDAIHALPAIVAKLNQGFVIDILTEEFLNPIFQGVGCACQAYVMKSEYGKIYNLKMWYSEHEADCGAEAVAVKLSRFEQFARILGVELTEKFDFRKYLL